MFAVQTIQPLIRTTPRRMGDIFDDISLTPATVEPFVGPPDYTETLDESSWDLPTSDARGNWWDTALSTVTGGLSQAAVDAARRAANLPPTARPKTTSLGTTVAKNSSWLIPVVLVAGAYLLLRKRK